MTIKVLRNITPLEAILIGNSSRKTLKSISYFEEKLYSDIERHSYDPSTRRESKILTGTGFIMHPKGGRFEDKVEMSFKHAGSEKTLTYYVPKKYRHIHGYALHFEHGFRSDGEPSIQLLNAKTNRQITTIEQLGDASEVTLNLVGSVLCLLFPEIPPSEQTYYTRPRYDGHVLHFALGRPLIGLLPAPDVYNEIHVNSWALNSTYTVLFGED